MVSVLEKTIRQDSIAYDEEQESSNVISINEDEIAMVSISGAHKIEREALLVVDEES
jgi:hypothetical protein